MTEKQHFFSFLWREYRGWLIKPNFRSRVPALMRGYIKGRRLRVGLQLPKARMGALSA